MASNTLDLTGIWDGLYRYKDVPDAAPATPFLATIKETSGAFTGTVLEPHEFDDLTIGATIHGRRDMCDSQFAKDYETDDEYYRETVQYRGTLSEDGEMITGEWSIGHWAGAFEMTRELGASEALAEKVSVAVEL